MLESGKGDTNVVEWGHTLPSIRLLCSVEGPMWGQYTLCGVSVYGG